MATFFQKFYGCLDGPRLYRILKQQTTEGRYYTPNFVEAISDKVIQTVRFCWSFSVWTSPVLVPILYYRGYLSLDGYKSLTHFLGSVCIVYCTAFCLRGLGRLSNPDYVAFITALIAARKSLTQETRKALYKFDAEYWKWPIDYRWNDASERKEKVPTIPTRSSRTSFSFTSMPLDILSYMAAHTFGRRMTYPGATALINVVSKTGHLWAKHPLKHLVENFPQAHYDMNIGGILNQQRAKIIEEYNGQRAKLLTENGDQIDTMFMDRRSQDSLTENGQTLVVCSEGNAAFYEMGCMSTPMELGYSLLGWNHPGFAGSTGVPFPSNEQKAIDAVMQYAINELNFQPENIILYSWSIGGFNASWAAMNYPDCKCLILDATFDDLLPLALAKMPQSFSSLTVKTVRTYLNLNISEQLCRYPGPVLLIRRTKDEMITTQFPPDLETNRGNVLLKTLLQHRYPKIVDETTLPLLDRWLLLADRAYQISLRTEYDVDDSLCQTVFKSYVAEHSSSFPMYIGEDFSLQQKNQFTLFLASKHMEDFDSTHCTPLPTAFFHKPWTFFD